MNAVGGASRGCPSHGTYARYNGRPGDNPRGCLCAPCQEAGRRYRARQALFAATGRSLMVDATEVQAHLRRLTAANMARNEIARRSGVSPSTVSVHLKGEWPTIRRTIALKLLAVRPDAPTPSAMVSSVGTVRRLRALAVLRYSTPTIGRECGLSVDSVCDLLAGRRRSVSVATRDAVAAGARRLAVAPGPSARAAQRAQREGWYSFAAWDDIDDPKCLPYRGRSRRGERRQGIVDDTAEMIAAGVSREDIARRLGLEWNSVLMAHARSGVSLMGVIS